MENIDAVSRVSEFDRGELHRNPKTASRAVFPVYGAIFHCNCAPIWPILALKRRVHLTHIAIELDATACCFYMLMLVALLKADGGADLILQ